MTKRGAPTKHGMSGTPELSAWAKMHDRCANPKYAGWHRYGGRGIRVCEEWKDFLQFYHDMGARPGAGYSLERIDRDGDYSPSNCKWATAIEQANNTCRSTILTHNGESKTLPTWAREVGICQKTLRQRIFKEGWPVARALETPKLSANRRKDNIWIECAGVSRTLSEWAKISGLNPVRISRRIRKGVPPDVAIFQKELIKAKRPNRAKRRTP